MSEWIDRMAEAVGQPPLTDDETAGILRVSREVAHRVERRTTPLAAFLLGIDVAGRMAGGEPRGEAVAASIAALDGLLPEPELEPDGG